MGLKGLVRMAGFVGLLVFVSLAGLLGLVSWWYSRPGWTSGPVLAGVVGAVGWLVGGGGKVRREPRAEHVFFIFRIKKELFIFIFQIKSISKGTL